MKAQRVSLRAAGALAPVLLLFLTGCAELPTPPSAVIPPTGAMYTARSPGAFVPPVPIHTVAPEFPLEMRRHGVTGVVTLDCLVDTQGQVQDPKVVKASDDDLIAPALAAIRKWKFEPGRRDGQPVPTRATIPIRFALNP